MPIELGRGTGTWGMVGATRLKGPEGETGVHDKNPADPHTLCSDVYGVPGVGQGAVEGEVEVDLESETDLLQVGISLSLVIAAGEQEHKNGNNSQYSHRLQPEGLPAKVIKISVSLILILSKIRSRRER